MTDHNVALYVKQAGDAWPRAIHRLSCTAATKKSSWRTWNNDCDRRRTSGRRQQYVWTQSCKRAVGTLFAAARPRAQNGFTRRARKAHCVRTTVCNHWATADADVAGCSTAAITPAATQASWAAAGRGDAATTPCDAADGQKGTTLTSGSSSECTPRLVAVQLGRGTCMVGGSGIAPAPPTGASPASSEAAAAPSTSASCHGRLLSINVATACAQLLAAPARPVTTASLIVAMYACAGMPAALPAPSPPLSHVSRFPVALLARSPLRSSSKRAPLPAAGPSSTGSVWLQPVYSVVARRSGRPA
jgi:hypothetical protein